MAKVELNSALKLLRGSIGNLVFKRHRKVGVIVSKRATHEDTKWSKEQKKGRRRWSDAAKYANAVWVDPQRTRQTGILRLELYAEGEVTLTQACPD